jgi:hypothetical protein
MRDKMAAKAQRGCAAWRARARCYAQTRAKMTHAAESDVLLRLPIYAAERYMPLTPMIMFIVPTIQAYRTLF